MALVKGQIGDGKDVLCRVHSECLTGDVFGSGALRLRRPAGHAAMKRIEQEGRGVLLYMRQEGRGIGLMNKLKAYVLQEQGLRHCGSQPQAWALPPDLREYWIGAQILRDLGVKEHAPFNQQPQIKFTDSAVSACQITRREPIEMPAAKV